MFNDNTPALGEVHRRAREQRARQDEIEVSQAVGELVRKHAVEDAVAYLYAYGLLLERRPSVREALPPVPRTEWTLTWKRRN